jgi:hypothetical protein
MRAEHRRPFLSADLDTGLVATTPEPGGANRMAAVRPTPAAG